MRRPAARGKTDSNQSDIVAALRLFGATVIDLHAVGGGCPDLLVGYRGLNLLMEVKTTRGKLEASQRAFMESWRGPVFVVRSIDDALAVLGKRWERRQDLNVINV